MVDLIYYGGPFDSLSQHFFLTPKLVDIVEYRVPKKYENEFFLTNLYLKKRYSLRRISKELGYSRNVVRKKLFEAELRNFNQESGGNLLVRRKIIGLREKGFSYQKIANLFNLWKIRTRSGEGKWFGKTIRGWHRISINTISEST